MKAYVKKIGEKYGVEIKQEHQYFRLDYFVNTKKEAEWMARMFNFALDRYTWKRMCNCCEMNEEEVGIPMPQIMPL